jgi:hypothetical protein
MGGAPALDLPLRHGGKHWNEREYRFVPEDRRHGAALPPPIGAFRDEDRIIADDWLERPAGRRVAPKGFDFLDKYFANQSRLADQKDIGITRAHPRHGFFVG